MAIVVVVLAANAATGALAQTSASASVRQPAVAGGSWAQTANFAYPTFTYLACPSTTTCFTSAGSDSYSTIARTTDGGVRWVAETVPANVEEPEALACPSTSTCIAIGRGAEGTGAVAMRTTDGGAHWLTKDLPAGMGSVKAISCATPSSCQVVGENSGGYGAAAARTTDGGAAWENDKLPPGMEGIADVSCPSLSTCEAVGANKSQYGDFVFRTTNGGRTWSAKHLTNLVPPAGLQVIYCRSVSFCVAGGNNAQAYPIVGYTVNGGQTWIFPKLSGTAVASLGNVSAIACPSRTVCEALVGPFAMRTTDGGAKWVDQVLPKTVASTNGLACPSVAVCQSSAGVAGNLVVSLRTTSGGASWVTAAPEPVTIARFTTVSCRSATVCEVGENGVGALRTMDGGTNWTTQTIGKDNGYLDAVDCLTVNLCQGVGDYGDYVQGVRTTNGGATWAESLFPTQDRMTAVDCPSASVCTSISYAPGAVYHTSDGGLKWALQTIPNPATIYPTALACPSISVCMVYGGATGAIYFLRTTDGGARWVSEKLPENVGELDDLACPTTSYCVALGQRAVSSGSVILGPRLASAPEAAASTPNDIVIRTTDGGAHWVLTNVPGTPNVTFGAISCPTPSVCEAAGVPSGDVSQSGYTTTGSTAALALMFRTTDGGATWYAQGLPAGVGSISSISCPTSSACTAVGSSNTAYGVVIRYR